MSNFDDILFELTPPELSIIAQNALEESNSRYISTYDEFIAWSISSCNRQSGFNVAGVKVHCYNNEYNLHDVYSIDEAAERMFSNPIFDIEQCIDIYIPGYNTPINASSVEVAKCIFSQIICNKKGTVTIIIDHSDYTTADFNEVKSYKKAVSYVKSIGEKIRTLVLSLLFVVKKDKISVIGHGLGGQMLGYAAQSLKNARKRLSVIYAVDPAGPCFTNCPDEHVRSGQADKLVTIHCSDTEGSTLNLADYDAYANDGKTQPGCSNLNYNCNHKTCVSIALLPAIRENIWRAERCPSYNDYKMNKCKSFDTMLIGYKQLSQPYAKIRKGVFYFSTFGDVIVPCLNTFK